MALLITALLATALLATAHQLEVARVLREVALEDLEDDGTFETFSSKIQAAAFKCFQGEFKRRMEIKEPGSAI